MNINDITEHQIGAKFIEWVDADRAYQTARADLYSEDFAHIDLDDEVYEPKEFVEPSKPYKEHESTEKAVEKMLETLRHQNNIYDELMELADLFIAGQRS